MKCRRCGHENEAGANFCSSCGASLTESASADDTTKTLAALAERQEIPEEVAGAAAEVPEGVGVLVVRRGPNAGSRFLLDAETTALGRHPDSDIFLDDITVSRRHAIVRRLAGGGYELRDDGSLNGTRLNNELIEAKALRSLDEIQVGRFVLTFIVGEAPGS
jgi:hypothetical protein